MTTTAIRAMMQNSDGKVFCFSFVDGKEMLATVISDSHVDENDTVVIQRIGALPMECAWNVHFEEISSILPANQFAKTNDIRKAGGI